MDIHREELGAEVRDRIAAASRVLEQLGELANGSSVSKARLRELVKEAQREIDGMPPSLQYILKRYAEAMEELTEASKTEVEAFAAHVVNATGLAAMRGVADGSARAALSAEGAGTQAS